METVKNENILYEELSERLTSFIARNGMRETQGRYLILKKICESKSFFSVNDIYTSILTSEQGDNISDIRSVYFAVDLFEQIGIIVRYPFFGKNRLYSLKDNEVLFSDNCK